MAYIAYNIWTTGNGLSRVTRTFYVGATPTQLIAAVRTSKSIDVHKLLYSMLCRRTRNERKKKRNSFKTLCAV